MKSFGETTSNGSYQNQYFLQRYSDITTVDELMRRLCKNSITQNDVHNQLFFILWPTSKLRLPGVDKTSAYRLYCLPLFNKSMLARQM